MALYTTEITSDQLVSDNPIHQRLLKAYLLAAHHVKGELLEIGCGEGRGMELFTKQVDRYLAIDKIEAVVNKLSKKYPTVDFRQAHVPPLEGIADNSFDVAVAFQVIEHLEDDRFFLEEVHRVLKKGGHFIFTTPNIKKSLTRNPWHVREYTANQLEELTGKVFSEVNMQGITGNQKVMDYYERNKTSVEKITRFDIFNLQYRLPRSVLQIPYEMMNRLNRNLLKKQNQSLVNDISADDYVLSDQPDQSLDLMVTAKK